MIRLAACALLLSACAGLRPPDARYESTPMPAVEAMLELAAVTQDDLVADLGCGDGRIVIEAVRRYGARGLCIDNEPERIREARENALAAGVAERIAFVNQNFFDADLRGVTVATLFLSPPLNRALRPKLERELAPGGRVVSYWFGTEGWPPERTVTLGQGLRRRPLYLWRIN
jgi:16S rRNA G966 N2-methylase RsmD